MDTGIKSKRNWATALAVITAMISALPDNEYKGVAQAMIPLAIAGLTAYSKYKEQAGVEKE